jgi:hypothetical protein
MAHQLTMTGDDWLSERDKQRAARNESARANAARALAARLRMAADAVTVFAEACAACGDQVERTDDSRARLRNDMLEYAYFLGMRYGERREG